MSLPDTVFIFVLALIIFGPKKLPEIGRQIGRLVGEFRRASNEFKFQIEEELRQVDFNEKLGDRQTIAAAKSDPLAASALPEAAMETEPEENIPVGQYPNIDNLDVSTLSDAPTGAEDIELLGDNGEAASASSIPLPEPPLPEPPHPELTIAPATGSMPRTASPYAPAGSTIDRAAEASIPLKNSAEPIPEETSIHSGTEHAEVGHG